MGAVNIKFPKVKPPLNRRSKYQWALANARAGYFVFPLKENLPDPIDGIDWRREATRDPAKIKTWWVNPDGTERRFNIGCSLEHPPFRIGVVK